MAYFENITLPSSLEKYVGGLTTPNLDHVTPFYTNDGKILDLIMDWGIPNSSITCPIEIYQYDQDTNSFFDDTTSLISGPIPTTSGAYYPIVVNLNGDANPSIYFANFQADNGATSGIDTLLSPTASGQYVDDSQNLPETYYEVNDLTSGVINSKGDIAIFHTEGGPPGAMTWPLYLISKGNGTFTNVSKTYAPAPLGEYKSYAWLVDVTGDELADLIAATLVPSTTPGAPPSLTENIYLNPGNGDFSNVTPIPLPPIPFSAAKISNGTLGPPLLPDIEPFRDASGKYNDLVALAEPDDGNGYAIQILMNNGKGDFTDETSTRLFGAPSVVNNAPAYEPKAIIFDLTGDGAPDIITVGGNGAPGQVFLNDGSDHFYLAYSFNTAISAGDWAIKAVTDIAGTPTIIAANVQGQQLEFIPFQSPPKVVNPIANQTTNAEQPFSYAMPANTFVDPSGQQLTYSASEWNGAALPGWLSFNPSTMTLSGTSPMAAEVYDIEITATDTNGWMSEDNFSLSAVASVTGGGQTVALGAGGQANLFDTGGDWDTVDGSEGSVDFTDAHSFIRGHGDSIHFEGAGNAASLAGTRDAPDVVTGPDGTVILTGAQVLLKGSHDTVKLHGASSVVQSGRSETFVFRPVIGEGTIKGFTSTDIMEFRASDFANFDALLADTSQSGANTDISLGAHDKVTLTDVSVSSLTASQFRFV